MATNNNIEESTRTSSNNTTANSSSNTINLKELTNTNTDLQCLPDNPNVFQRLLYTLEMHNGFGMFNLYERIISHTFVGLFVILVLLSFYVFTIGLYDGITCQYNRQYHQFHSSNVSSNIEGLVTTETIPVVPATYNVASNDGVIGSDGSVVIEDGSL